MNHENERFARKYGPWALVAGGSEGIGRSYALQLASRGLNLILVARRQQPLDATAREILEHFDVQVSTHSADLTTLDPEHGLDEIVDGREVGLLVYNAGATHGAGFLIDNPLRNALGLVRLNCMGPLILVHSLGSRMRDRGRGGIILMSSMSALGGGGYVAAYAATKAFDRALAEALWWEFGARRRRAGLAGRRDRDTRDGTLDGEIRPGRRRCRDAQAEHRADDTGRGRG